MKKKELKNLAKTIADCEYLLQHTDNEEKKMQARNTIMQISSKIHDLQDLDTLDEMVQEFMMKLDK